MKEVIDRVPTRPNRIKLTSESDGSINYYTWERADEPITDGTPINKELFDSIGADITSLQQKTQTNTSDIQAIKTHDNEQDSKIANLNNATRINLLRPTLGTITVNGVSCHNNGDGTYTLNGTSTLTTNLPLLIEGTLLHLPIGKYKIFCSNDKSSYYIASKINDIDHYENAESNIFDCTNGNVTFNYCYIQILKDKSFSNVIVKPMITPNLNATYNDFVSYEDSLATNKVMSTRVNLLKPTLQTQTKNGVTCTNNGGTYTLNGTATAQTIFNLTDLTANTFIGAKMLGCPSGGSSSTYCLIVSYYNETNKYQKEAYDSGRGKIIESSPKTQIGILIRSGTVCNKLLFKPMITTDLKATYNDFIACLGTSWTQDSTNGYYIQTIACNGITSNDNPTIDVVLIGTLAEMQAQQEEWGKILKVETSSNTLKFYASEATTVSLSVMVKGV